MMDAPGFNIGQLEEEEHLKAQFEFFAKRGILLTRASEREDKDEATDAWTGRRERISLKGTDWAIATSKFGEPLSSPYIKTVNPSGGKSELEKILEGYGDYMLYCIWCGGIECLENHPQPCGRLYTTTLISLRVFREKFSEIPCGKDFLLPTKGSPGTTQGYKARRFFIEDIPELIICKEGHYPSTDEMQREYIRWKKYCEQDVRRRFSGSLG